MPAFRYQSLGPLPSPGGTRAFLGLAIRDGARAEPVVLVWVPPELAQDVEKSERLQRETERAALLDHPHIVRVYGFARLDQGLARVVEFADGETLRSVLEATGPVPPPLAARLIADAAQGVHYAHLAGNDDGTPLLHGDLRPETLLVTYSGMCKVSGYGASAFAPQDGRVRNLRLAPEQVIGGRAAMNVQTDVYLLGATLFELLTGKAPFEGEPEFEHAVLSKEPKLAAHPQIPLALAAVLKRALAKKAADRFPSAQVLREALELAIRPLPSHEELAAWLGQRFPDDAGARAARQQMIDRAVADFARKQWERQAAPEQPSAQPPFPQVTGMPHAPAAPPPAPAPRHRPLPTELQKEAEEPPRPRRPGLVALIVIVSVIAAGGLIYALSKRESDREAYPPGLTTRVEKDAGTPPRPADAGPPGAAVTPDPPGPANVATSLALTVEPRVNVEVDGRAAGRTPVRIPLAPGRHKLRLIDKAEGVDVTRFVVVDPSGVTNEEVYLQKGFVAVSAPPGAQIEIDGRTVGRAPLGGDVTVYEGSHRIDVTMGRSRWGEAFVVKPSQRVTFDVGPQYE